MKAKRKIAGFSVLAVSVIASIGILGTPGIMEGASAANSKASEMFGGAQKIDLGVNTPVVSRLKYAKRKTTDKVFSDSMYLDGNYNYLGRSIQYGDSAAIKNAVKLDEYTSARPTITILDPGMGGSASNWSSRRAISKDGSNPDRANYNFAYNSESLVADLLKSNDNCELYLAKVTSQEDFGFSLINCYVASENSITSVVNKQDLDFYVDPRNSGEINDFSKHIIIVYDSYDSNQGLDQEYADFENLINYISYDYKLQTGIVPKINLISHSRGGTTNIRYASNYPYNIDSVFSLATPYRGTDTGAILDKIMDDGIDLGDLVTLDNPAYHDIQNKKQQKALIDDWNDAYRLNPNIRAYAIGSAATLPFYTSLAYEYFDTILDFLNLTNLGETQEEIDFFEATFNLVKSWLKSFDEATKTLSVSEDYEKESYNQLIDYDDYIAKVNLDKEKIKSDLKQIYETFKKNQTTLVNKILNAFESIKEPGIFILDKIIGTLVGGDYNAASETIDMFVDMFEGYNEKEIILNNDLFVDVPSEMAEDFDGFERKIKIYTDKFVEDHDTIEVVAHEPAIPHNLEPYDKEMRKYILEKIVVGKLSDNQGTTVSKESTIDITLKTMTTTSILSTTNVANVKGFEATTDSHILISDRSNPLTINLTDVCTAVGIKTVSSFIEYCGNTPFQLNIIYRGQNQIYAYNDAGVVERTLDLRNVDVMFSSGEDKAQLDIYGMDGKNGSYGDHGSDGQNGRPGKNGTSGSTGCDGQDGQMALECDKLTLRNARHLYLRGGNGGIGGRGGDGGNGGNGNRIDGGARGGDGGNGGNGGNGGHGGKGSKAVLTLYDIKLIDCDQTTVIGSGIAGNGGDGGNGGNGGNGSQGTNWANLVYAGGNGGNGGEPGHGGDGGICENAYVILDGVLDANCEIKFYLKHISKGGWCGYKFGNGGNAGVGASPLTTLFGGKKASDGTPGKSTPKLLTNYTVSWKKEYTIGSDWYVQQKKTYGTVKVNEFWGYGFDENDLPYPNTYRTPIAGTNGKVA